MVRVVCAAAGMVTIVVVVVVSWWVLYRLGVWLLGWLIEHDNTETMRAS